MVGAKHEVGDTDRRTDTHIQRFIFLPFFLPSEVGIA